MIADSVIGVRAATGAREVKRTSAEGPSGRREARRGEAKDVGFGESTPAAGPGRAAA